MMAIVAILLEAILLDLILFWTCSLLVLRLCEELVSSLSWCSLFFASVALAVEFGLVCLWVTFLLCVLVRCCFLSSLSPQRCALCGGGGGGETRDGAETDMEEEEEEEEEEESDNH